MNLIGRYEKVRTIGPQGYGPPLMLDRGSKSVNAQVRPYKGEYWDRTRAGLYVPRISGGVGFAGHQLGMVMVPSSIAANTTSLGQGTVALDSNYVAGTSGDAVSVRIQLQTARTFDTLYFFVVSYTGTAANVNDLDLEIRSDAATGIPVTTAPGLLDSETIDPASATGWISKQFATPISMSAGTVYHLIVGDADGNGTDYATILRNTSNLFQGAYIGGEMTLWEGKFTTTGWAAGNSVTSAVGSICAKFADGKTLGCPFTNSEAPTSNQLARGLLMSGLTEQLKIFGVSTTSSSANYSQIDIFAGTDLSNATPFSTASVPLYTTGSSTVKAGFLFGTMPTLAKATQYRIVFRYSSNTALPLLYNVGVGGDAALKSAMFGGGSWYWTIDSAGPVWVDDDDAWPNMVLLVEDQVAVTSGGGMRLAGHGGLAA